MILLPLILGSALAAPNTDQAAPIIDVAPLASLSSALLHDVPEEEIDETVWHGSINLGELFQIDPEDRE